MVAVPEKLYEIVAFDLLDEALHHLIDSDLGFGMGDQAAGAIIEAAQNIVGTVVPIGIAVFEGVIMPMPVPGG